MRAWRKGSRSILVAALVAASGCSGGGGDETVAPVPTTPPPATTLVATTAVAPPTTTPVSDVPAVIDVAYVERVMTVLDTIEGEAVKELVAKRKTTEAFHFLLESIYVEPGYSRIRDQYRMSVASNTAALRPSPGQPRTDIASVVDWSSTCVVARVERSYREVFADAPEHEAGFVQLSAKLSPPTGDALNRTRWKIVNAVVDNDEARIPDDPCR